MKLALKTTCLFAAALLVFASCQRPLDLGFDMSAADADTDTDNDADSDSDTDPDGGSTDGSTSDGSPD